MKYTEEHEWLDIEDDLVVVGITAHASEQLGDIVFVELPDVDTVVSKDDEVVVIESVKAASDILAPLDGEIVEVNSALEDAPATINEDPTGKGWIFKMKIEDLSVLDELLDEAAYKKLIAKRGARVSANTYDHVIAGAGTAGPLHGTAGPLVIDHQSERYELTETFLAACGQAGIAFNGDLNGTDNPGSGYFPATIDGNERCDTAGAEREVILCAGAISSPHLLLLSGIGPADALGRARVALHHDLPGVGENLPDHFHFRLCWEIGEPLTTLHGRSAPEVARDQARYDDVRQGPLTASHFESGAFLFSDPGWVATPDIELLMIPFFISLDASENRPPDRHGFTISGFPTRPASRGTVSLATGDPLDRPVTDPSYLSDPADMKRMVEIVKRAPEIVAHPGFDAIRRDGISPGPDVQTDAEIAKSVRRSSSTSFHPVGACRMGRSTMAVVDPDLRVRGVEGLRAVDASVMPEMITGHTNAPTAMIAQMAADRTTSAAAVL